MIIYQVSKKVYKFKIKLFVLRLDQPVKLMSFVKKVLN